jgi:hypothetical protein
LANKFQEHFQSENLSQRIELVVKWKAGNRE